MITKPRMKNTGQMICAVKNNLEKFNIVKKLSQSITKVIDNKTNIINKNIKTIYEVVFKNLCSKKTKTDLVTENYVYYVTNTGISRQQNNSYSVNAESITSTDYYNMDFGKQLLNVGLNQSHFLKVLSKQKKQIFKQFMKGINLLKVAEKSSLMIKDEIEVRDYNYVAELGHYDNKKIKKVGKEKVIELQIMEVGEIKICYKINNKKYKNYRDILTSNQKLGDFILIEQLYTQIKKLLETELKIREKELKNAQKFLDYLKITFSSHLMFKELQKS